MSSTSFDPNSSSSSQSYSARSSGSYSTWSKSESSSETDEASEIFGHDGSVLGGAVDFLDSEDESLFGSELEGSEIGTDTDTDHLGSDTGQPTLIPNGQNALTFIRTKIESSTGQKLATLNLQASGDLVKDENNAVIFGATTRPASTGKGALYWNATIEWKVTYTNPTTNQTETLFFRKKVYPSVKAKFGKKMYESQRSATIGASLYNHVTTTILNGEAGQTTTQYNQLKGIAEKFERTDSLGFTLSSGTQKLSRKETNNLKGRVITSADIFVSPGPRGSEPSQRTASVRMSDLAASVASVAQATPLTPAVERQGKFTTHLNTDDPTLAKKTSEKEKAKMQKFFIDHLAETDMVIKEELEADGIAPDKYAAFLGEKRKAFASEFKTLSHDFCDNQRTEKILATHANVQLRDELKTALTTPPWKNRLQNPIRGHSDEFVLRARLDEISKLADDGKLTQAEFEQLELLMEAYEKIHEQQNEIHENLEKYEKQISDLNKSEKKKAKIREQALERAHRVTKDAQALAYVHQMLEHIKTKIREEPGDESDEGSDDEDLSTTPSASHHLGSTSRRTTSSQPHSSDADEATEYDADATFTDDESEQISLD